MPHNISDTDTFPIVTPHWMMERKPKGRRRVLWNSSELGTYIKSVHGKIGTAKRKKHETTSGNPHQ